jgi:8-amino-7-oxononanoate synthase
MTPRRASLLARLTGGTARAPLPAAAPDPAADIPDDVVRFDKFPGYEKLLLPQLAARQLGIANPFFRSHDGVAGATTRIEGRDLVNFANYNYLGFAGDPRVDRAAKDAIDRYGTSASASRLVAGERPVHRDLETALAAVYGVEAALVFVSGHATNVTTIGTLFGPRDLILHDALIHNSTLEGIRLSGATRRAFPHNDCAALDTLLAQSRGRFERVLICVEGLYSMDGDIPDLARLVDIKRRHKAFLMVDDAHALGVLGATGRGLHEEAGVPGDAVDIWMGTLSKTLAAAGGYIAGPAALIEQLRYGAGGFVYSVGLAPPLAAAAAAALALLRAEPERVARLRANAALFLETARAAGLDTGRAQGFAVVPVIAGSSLKAVRWANALFAAGIHVQPIIHPAVEERAARLRFFLTSAHTPAQIAAAVREMVHVRG